MKSKILTLLFVLGCCGFAFSQTCPGINGVSSTAGTVDIAPTETCADGSVVGPFTVTPAGGDADVLYLTLDGPTGTILSLSGASADSEADVNATAVGTEVCVQPVSFNQADFDNLVTIINQWCTDNAFFCGLIPGGALPLPAGATLEDIFALAGGLGATLDVATVEALINNGMAATGYDLGAPLGVAGILIIDLPAICYEIGPAVCVTATDACAVTCAVAADLAAAPTAPTVTESVCGADGATLEGGVVDPITCPAGSTAEYSIDAGATWATTVSAYDQTTAITVTVRCLCDEDMMTASPTAEVTTVPGTCTTVGCGIAAGEPAMATADVCLQDIGTVDVTGIFADPSPAGTPSLVQNYAVTDMATGDLITISNSAMLDLTGAQVGAVACVTAIAYTQETLDVITAAIDNVTQIPFSPIPPLGSLDLSGFLNGLNGAFEIVGVEFTAADIQSWCETQTLTIPFSQLPGGLIPDLTLDLMTLIPPSGFCCDFSDSDYCLTVIDCSTPCDPATCNNVTVTITSAMLDTSDPGFNEGNPLDNTTETVFIINGVQFFADVNNSGGVEAVTLTPCAGNTFVVGPTSICADAPAVTVDMLVFDDDDAGDGRCDPFDPDAGLFGAEGDDEIWPDNSGANPGVAGAVPFDLTATSFVGGPITIEYTVSCEAVTCEPCPACDPLVSTTTAPPAVVTSESTCEADGVTLSGGVIDVPAAACPAGSTLEYSIDAGATWSATLPVYDQMVAVTVDTRCVCDSDATDISTVASVTTVPGMCMTATCEADAPELDAATGDCAADDGDMMETPFTWPLNAASTENTTPPYITEYIVTDVASGNIIGVFPTLAAAEAAANTEITTDVDGNATACIQPINHDSANFEAVVTAIDTDAGGLLCGSGIITCPVTTLEALYNGLAGAGVAIDAATVVGLVGAPNAGNPGLDLGTLLGLPFPLVVDVPPFCYELGVEVCATNAACPVMCDPAIAAATAPAAVITSESTCEADGTTLSGGVIDVPAAACPAGSTLEYSVDAGATWSTTLPTYDQTTAVTVDTRCVCDLDAAIVSLTGTVTTVPGMCTATCDPAIAAATAPAATVSSESTCEADGTTLSGGVIDVPAAACPAGSTLEYSVDAGATWSTTLPTYDQTTAVTVDTRCVCDLDAAIVSLTGTATTVPGTCPPPSDFDFTILDPCVCNGDETYTVSGSTATPDNVGTFGELIQVMGPTGFTLTTDAASTGGATSMTLTENPAGSGIYELAFDHVTNVGYTANLFAEDASGTVTPVGSISNICAYPTYTLIDATIDLSICSDGSLEVPPAATIPITLSADSGAASAGTFSPDPFDPNQGAGTYTIMYTGVTTADDGNAGVSPDGGTTPAFPSTADCPIAFDQTITVEEVDICVIAENIPTVGQWGLIILGLMMSITAVVGIRQRREEEAYS